MSLTVIDGAAIRIAPRATSAFADMIARVDRAVQDRLGGVPVIYQPAIGEAVEVVGIFDAQYLIARGDPLAGVEALGPAVFLRLEDLPVDPEQDEPVITVGNLDYRVTERKPDGMGGIALMLRLVG